MKNCIILFYSPMKSAIACILSFLLIGLSYGEIVHPANEIAFDSIVLRDPTGKVVTEVSLVTHIASGDYTFDAGSQEGEWNITPDLPYGISFSHSNHKMSGTSYKEVPRKQYSVTLTTSSTTLSMTFFLEVKDCKEGYYLIRHIDNTMAGHVRISRGDEVLEETDIASQIGDRYFCLPRGEVKVSFSCTSSSDSFCSFTLYSTEDVTYIALVPKPGETKEATTTMIPSAAPTISVNSDDFILFKGQMLKALISVSEIHKHITFNPPLSPELSFDQRTHILTGRIGNGPYPVYTVSTSNDKGSASETIHFYVDSCPEGLTLVKLTTNGFARDVRFAIETLDGKELRRITLKDLDYARNLCLPAGEYFIAMFSTEIRDLWIDPLELRDPNGKALEVFQKTRSGPVQRERFVVGYAIPQGSTMKFLVAESAPTKWSIANFKDADWSDGSVGKWGSLPSGKSAYFRKTFSVSRGDGYSMVQLAITATDKTTVYLNGEEIALITDASEEVMIDIPATYLTDGVNVLAAVQSLRSNSHMKQSLRADSPASESIVFATIVFDARLRLATTRCIASSFSGDVSSDKPVESRFPPRDAFSDMYVYWRTQLPANLFYTLTPNRFIMPYLMRAACKSCQELRPTELRVFGRVVDPATNQTLVEEEIAHMQSPFFLEKKEYEMIRLESKRPYNAFRVEYVDSLNHTKGAINGLAFSVCQTSECKKKWGVKARVVGESQIKKCPMGYYGVRRMTCGRDDVAPAWEDDRSMCLAKHATKGTAFIDTELYVPGMREESMDKFITTAKSIITSQLTVLESQISFPYVMLATNEVAVSTVMRFTVEEEVGDYVLKKTKENLQALVDQMKTEAQLEGLSVKSHPTLRKPFQWLTLLIIIAMVVIAVVSFICGYFFHSLSERAKESDSLGRKQLKRGKGAEGLLDDANLRVCLETSCFRSWIIGRESPKEVFHAIVLTETSKP